MCLCVIASLFARRDCRPREGQVVTNGKEVAERILQSMLDSHLTREPACRGRHLIAKGWVLQERVLFNRGRCRHAWPVISDHRRLVPIQLEVHLLGISKNRLLLLLKRGIGEGERTVQTRKGYCQEKKKEGVVPSQRGLEQ